MPDTRPWFEVLGVSPLADDEQIRDAYLALVKSWHPDRFAGDARTSAEAEERLKEINAAYAFVKTHPFASDLSPRQSGAKLTVDFPYGEPQDASWEVESDVPSFLISRRGLLARVVAFLLILMFVAVTIASHARVFGRRGVVRAAPSR